MLLEVHQFLGLNRPAACKAVEIARIETSLQCGRGLVTDGYEELVEHGQVCVHTATVHRIQPAVYRVLPALWRTTVFDDVSLLTCG
ncbi:hypothetical protein HMPREF0291_10825 [Corynebacterium genitalium ATCC 33030]|uniref:Uncharacterized protein n=1 Tax=Corynebacterium genitalium ATCC 33030 TaxID=585529 RepID=D7W9V0_9CORY|nr:hypothetical protein HMPREF0291_10825 [Corynebacterium genitalium ATCC 33030]